MGIMKELAKNSLKRVDLYPGLQEVRRQIRRSLPREVRRRRDSARFYSRFIRDGDLCFDVGANIGDKTEIFLSLGARVVCIEPHPECLRCIHRRFGKNRRVLIIDKALGDKEGFSQLHICDAASTISTMSTSWMKEGRFSKDFTWRKTQSVALTTLDAVIRTHGMPTFCKIDVEGYEETVLKGLSKHIPYLSFEFSREFFDAATRCTDRLSAIGNAKFNFSVAGSMRLLLDRWAEPSELFKALSVIEDDLLWGDVYTKFE
jgi:FkbM family methyltransferase